tara:strand:- start:175 stop:384 length:210 start_codon:yes stop_codon:yes gene_type:complete
MDLIQEGNLLIQQVTNLLNEVSPEQCPSGAEFTNFLVANADRLPTDAATIVALAADLEAQLLDHEGTVH